MHHEVWDPRGPEGLRHRPPPCGGSCYTKHPLVLDQKRGVCETEGVKEQRREGGG